MDIQSTLRNTLGDTYSIERELGGGGMSRVFLAQDTTLGRPVVVKLLAPELAAEVNAERFRREISLAAGLQHACIVPLLSAGSAGDLPFFTMPFVEGESLRARIARDGALPLADAVRILRDCAEALSYAHERGVIHRDIKPENILLTRHHALISDFGVAKALSAAAATHPGSHHTTHGFVLGTPGYMPPEQALGDPAIDQRADLYSLGVVAYEMLSGAHPFGDRRGHALLAAHALETPAPLIDRRRDVPPALGGLIQSCLEKDPSRRPASADVVLSALDALAPTIAEPRQAFGRRARRLLTAAAVLTVVGALAATARFGGRPAAPPVVATTSGIPSIAVLPFVNASGSAENEYLSDGIADELIGALGRVEGLRTAARSATFVYKSSAVSAQEIGRRLRVGAVLEGTVRRVGDSLRVTAQLVDTADGLAVWSGRFEGELRGVFQVQDQIARQIVSALSVRLTSAPPAASQTRSLEAYDAYLRGRYEYNKFTEPNLRRALAHFERALILDSTYAPAWAGIAEVYISLADDWLPPVEAYPAAKRAAIKALLLDSTLASAHASLGTIQMSFDWDFASAEREFRIARRLRPNDPWAYNQIATLLLRSSDRTGEALAEIERARLLDSLDVTYQAGLAAALLWLARYDESIAAGERALAMEEKGGIHIIVGDAHLAAGRPREALRAFRRAETLGYVRAPEGIARALVAVGDSAGARRIAGDLERAAADRYQRAEYIARVWAALGDHDRAFAWLDTAYRQRSAGLTWLAVHPAYRPLRSHPRYEPFLARMGLRRRPA